MATGQRASPAIGFVPQWHEFVSVNTLAVYTFLLPERSLSRPGVERSELILQVQQ